MKYEFTLTLKSKSGVAWGTKLTISPDAAKIMFESCDENDIAIFLAEQFVAKLKQEKAEKLTKNKEINNVKSKNCKRN